MPAEADRAIGRFEVLEPNQARQALLRAVVASRGNDFATAKQAITKAIELADPQIKLGLQCMEVELLLAAGENEQALAASEALVEANPRERRVLQVALESALRMKKYAVAEEWEGRFRAAAPTDTFTAGVFEARRLLDQYDDLPEGERTHLAQLVQTLRDQRPDWGDIIALSARISDLQNDRSQALADYQRAVARGVKNPTVIERLVTLLYAEGRADEADGYFARLASSRASSPAIDSLKIADAVQRNDLGEAIQLAEKGVDENPDDPVRRIWLARLLLENKETDVAERTLRDALAVFPEDARVWSALFLLLHRAQKIDAARELLDQFVAKSTANSWERHLIAAQAFQALGDNERALTEAQAAVDAKGDNIPSRMLLGKLLMAVDVDRAAAEYEKVLAIDKTHGEARRNLSILQAMSGDESEWREALSRLQSDDTGGMTADGLADNRVRAALLSNQGRNRQQRLENLVAARKIMLEQIETRGAAAPDLDRLFLAKLYEQESALRGDVTLLQAAREQFQQLSSRPNAPVANLREYAEFLLRHLETTDAPPGQEQAWAALRSSMRDDGALLADECTRRLDAHTINPDRPTSVVEALNLVSARVRLLSLLGDDETARETLAKFEVDKLPEMEKLMGQPRSWIPLAGLHAAIDDHARAEEWYRKLLGVAPETYPLLVRELANQDRVGDAVEVCLAEASKSGGSPTDAAIVLAQVLASAPEESASMARGEPAIAAALKSQPENLDLLLAVAVLRVAQHDDAEAIRLFEQVVKLAPKHPLALNNLATLLAEQPERREAAMGFVKRAMDESGRQPPFLDTLGTIQMRSGEAQQAIASLEEAVANGGGDPRYYFHLAAAYRLGQQPDEARAALREAIERGLDEQILTQGDKQLLLELKQELAPAATPQLESQTIQPDNELQSTAAPARQFAA
jgi:tetratricopeptide (TPR) repeat protein